jgi:hypothetical protein
MSFTHRVAAMTYIYLIGTVSTSFFRDMENGEDETTQDIDRTVLQTDSPLDSLERVQEEELRMQRPGWTLRIISVSLLRTDS